MPEIRRVTLEDVSRVRALRVEMLADSPLAFIERLDEAVARPRERYVAHLGKRAGGNAEALFVAEADGRLVGQAGGCGLGPLKRTSLVYAVYVSPPWRGTGLLRRLVDTIAAWSIAAGRPSLELEVVTSNNRAIHAYQRLGFVDTGRRAPHPTMPVFTEQLMARAA